MSATRAEWKTIRIGDLGEVVTGGTPSSKHPEFFGNAYPFITPTDMDGALRHIKTERYLSEEGRLNQINRQLPSGAVCFVCIGATIGKVCMAGRPSFTNQQINSVIVDEERHDNRFVYYLLSTLKDKIKGIAAGAATPIVNKSSFSNVEVSVPWKHTQARIATVLSAYDDLIENNRRRIKILEEMAQNLYREWFIKFRFPGHEKVCLVDSPLGKIPEGWEWVPFTEIADVLSGGTPKTTVQEYWGGSIPFFAPRDSPDFFYVTKTEKSITELGLSKCNSQLYPKDTVFITARGTVGEVVMPAVDMAMNQSCYALRGKEGISQHFLFLMTKEQIHYLKKNTGGATFDTIVVDTFRRMVVARPRAEVVNQFSQLILPLMEAILNALKKNVILRQTRDLLLPKLISGELDVSALDIAIPEEAA